MAAAVRDREEVRLSAPVEDTIVALSSGRPPAAIGVIRISGSVAQKTAEALAGKLPLPRRAGLRELRDAHGAELDRALVLVFPGPRSATGEDLVELHCHGGRAVLAAVEAAVAARPGVRRAEPGEFTRRALLNGRIDLAEAEGLADLLAAETEGQRRAALQAAEGAISREVRGWLATLNDLSAAVEVAIDYDDEADAKRADTGVAERLAELVQHLRQALSAPPVERLRDGVRVVIAGPPNSGKSTLINALAGREVAIISMIAGTTRDRIDAAVQRGGLPFVLSDTAGLTKTEDPIEALGIGLARHAMATADVMLWLGDDAPPDLKAVAVHPRCDVPGRAYIPAGRLGISALTGEGLDHLWGEIERRARALLPQLDQIALNERQRSSVGESLAELDTGIVQSDPVLLAEQLRRARLHLAEMIGVNATEAMLDTLFARFCLGK